MWFGCFYLQQFIFGEVNLSLKHKFLFSVFVIFFILVFIALGLWQIIRLNWKNNLIFEIENSLKNPPVELAQSKKENYLKIYEKSFSKISYSQEVLNGLYISGSLEYASRKPLFNTSNFVVFGRDIPFQSNNPIDPTNFTAPFNTHNIASLNIGTSIVFDQKYVSYPNRKINFDNSRYPSLSIRYRKNFGSNVSEYNSNVISSK